MSFPSCFSQSYFSPKLTNGAVTLFKSFSGLYSTQFTGSLICFLLGLHPWVSTEKVPGRYCWDHACLKMSFFTLVILLFGYTANLGKKHFTIQNPEDVSPVSSSFQCCYWQIEDILIDNLVCPTPPLVFWNFTIMCFDMDLFIICCAEF